MKINELIEVLKLEDPDKEIDSFTLHYTDAEFDTSVTAEDAKKLWERKPEIL